MQLTRDQQAVLRSAPTAGRPNRLRLALALANVTQSELVQATGLAQPYVSDVVRGRFQDIGVENARKFADFFGVLIEDLFPPRSPSITPRDDKVGHSCSSEAA